MTEPTARVVIELNANGSITMESYKNGQRQQLTLSRGQEWWEILDELAMQKRQAIAQAERKAEAEAKAGRMRHNRVWTDAAQKFGTGFAARTIKGDVPPSFGRYMLPEPTPKSKSKATPAAMPVISADDFL